MLVTIATFSSLIDAQVARSRLQAANVPAIIPDEHMLNTSVFYSQALGGIKLQVNPEYVELAKDVLSNIDQSGFEDLIDKISMEEHPTDFVQESTFFDDLPKKMFKLSAIGLLILLPTVIILDYVQGKPLFDMFTPVSRPTVRVLMDALGCVEKKDYDLIRVSANMYDLTKVENSYLLRMLVNDYISTGKCRQLVRGEMLYQNTIDNQMSMINVSDTLGVGAIWTNLNVVEAVNEQK